MQGDPGRRATESANEPSRQVVSKAPRRNHDAHRDTEQVPVVDGVLVETMNTVAEAGAALEAANVAGLPALVSFVCDGSGRLLSGEPLEEALSQ